MTQIAPTYIRGHKFAEPVIAERFASLASATAALMQDVAAGAHENLRPADLATARSSALQLQRTATQLAMAVGAIKPGGGQ